MAPKDELNKALKSTSIKGIPRILSSTSSFLKLLWTLAVLSFFALCAWQASYNISEYITFDSVMTIKQAELDLLKKHKDLFPKILVCNKNPFSSNLSAYNSKDAPTPQEFLDFAVKMLKCGNNMTYCNADAEGIDLDIAKSLLLGPSGYYENFGKDAASKVGHQNLVIECRAIIDHSSMLFLHPCTDRVRVQKIVNPYLFNCFRYEAIIGEGDLFYGMSFILHTDSGFHNPLQKLNTFSFPTETSGAWISLIPHNTVPLISPESVSVAPGFDTTISFGITTVERLPKPYNTINCIKNSDYMQDKYNLDFDYSFVMCKTECTRELIAQNCSCNNIQTLNYPEYREFNLSYCSSLKNKTRAEHFNTLRCIGDTMKRSMKECVKECDLPCSEVEYKASLSMSKWPLLSQIGDFYVKHIKNAPFAESYESYSHIFEALSSDQGSTLSESDKWKAATVITENFARVSVYIGNSHIINYKEKEKLTFSSFLSQLGGTLNLWSGITVVVLIEIVDFIYRLMMSGSSTEGKECLKPSALSRHESLKNISQI